MSHPNQKVGSLIVLGVVPGQETLLPASSWPLLDFALFHLRSGQLGGCLGSPPPTEAAGREHAVILTAVAVWRPCWGMETGKPNWEKYFTAVFIEYIVGWFLVYYMRSSITF